MLPKGILPLLAIAVMVHFETVTSLRCIECSQAHFHGDPDLDDCYRLDKASTANGTNCVDKESDAYCYTKIELSDGILSYLERGCTNPRKDFLHASDQFPESTKCTTSFATAKASRNIQQTECYLPCKRNACNNVKIFDGMKSCPGVCPSNTECNYFTGACQCAPNRQGVDCASSVSLVHNSRSCVQCNSKTDPDCANKKNGSQCQNGETLCSTTQTWILKSDGTANNRSVVTRSCTSQYVSPDRCFLTSSDDIESAKYTEYTCVSTCSADNCNTGTANGVIDDEFIPIKCVVCEGDTASCGPERTLTTDCPSSTTHCLSTVTYWETVVNDTNLKGRLRPEPSVSVRHIKRQCASRSVTPKCTKRRVGLLSLDEVTCEETCGMNGCNTGWPNRPKCVICTTAEDDGCLKEPPKAKFCPAPHHEYCYTYQRNDITGTLERAEPGGKLNVIRGCSKNAGDSTSICKNVTDYARPMGTECTRYCRQPGCNFAEILPEKTDGESGALMAAVSFQVQLITAVSLLAAAINVS